MGAWDLIILAMMFAPLYLREKIFTIPEFLERRFGWSLRAFLSANLLVQGLLPVGLRGLVLAGLIAILGSSLPRRGLLPAWPLNRQTPTKQRIMCWGNSPPPAGG